METEYKFNDTYLSRLKRVPGGFKFITSTGEDVEVRASYKIDMSEEECKNYIYEDKATLEAKVINDVKTVMNNMRMDTIGCVLKIMNVNIHNPFNHNNSTYVDVRLNQKKYYL